jgi:hypothetical protein
MAVTVDSKFDIFLSHSSRDQEFSSRLASDLAEAGLRVWIDQWHIRPGESFAEAIDVHAGLEVLAYGYVA